MRLDEIRQDFAKQLEKTGIIKDSKYIGSNISVILDILAYIKYHTVIGTNLAVKNILLPSTTVYKNAVSFAKNILGYQISSPRGARAKITVTPNNSTYTLKAGTVFEGEGVDFYVTKDYIIENRTTIEVKEGTKIDYTIDPKLKFTSSEELASYIIPYENIDTESILVKIDGVIQKQVKYLINLKEDTYFIDYYTDGKPWVKLIFEEIGYGKTIRQGQEVEISFMVVRGSGANGIGTFSPKDDIPLTINGSSPSHSGTDIESLESIKFNAPKKYNSSSVTATKNDYEAALEELPLVKKGTAWGGETEFPQQLGHINICCIPSDPNQLFLTNEEYLEVINSIANKRIISTTKNIRYPQYIVVDFDIIIIGQLHQNILTEKQRQITEIIDNFFETKLQNFESPFFGSSLTRQLDSLFINEDTVTVDIRFKPKMLVNNIVKEQERTGVYRTYIPNALVRYKMVHESDPTTIIDIPDDHNSLSDLLRNGWKVFHSRDNPININFRMDNVQFQDYEGGSLYSKPLSFNISEDSTTLKNMGLVAEGISGVDYNPDGLDKGIYLKNTQGGEVKVGVFSNMLSCIEWQPFFKSMVEDLNSDVYINLDYQPYFNVIGVKNSYWKKGTVNFI